MAGERGRLGSGVLLSLLCFASLVIVGLGVAPAGAWPSDPDITRATTSTASDGFMTVCGLTYDQATTLEAERGGPSDDILITPDPNGAGLFCIGFYDLTNAQIDAIIGLVQEMFPGWGPC